jgi:hypothetical protein
VASVLAWVVGAVAAVAVGVLALSMIGDDLTSRTAQPLSPDAVAREASAAPTEPAAGPSESTGSSELAPAPSASSAAPATTAAPVQGSGGVEKLVSSPGGTAIARCANGQVYLVSWSPEQGYRTDDVARGPATVASVKFESDANKVFLSVRCAGSEPQGSIGQQADDHGGRGKKKDG